MITAAPLPNSLSLYQRLIIEVTGCPLADVAEIEELMRDDHPTLCSLSRECFTRLARHAQRRLPAIRMVFGSQGFNSNL